MEAKRKTERKKKQRKKKNWEGGELLGKGKFDLSVRLRGKLTDLFIYLLIN